MTNALFEPADNTELRKARGAFFTPSKITEFVSKWAIRDVNDRILEPSCGEAAFLLSAAARVSQLRAENHDALSMGAPQFNGVELHATSARTATELLADIGVEANIVTSDFFLINPTPTYDVVIGNPPYVRYQDFGGESRARSRAAALRGGVNLTALASSWAAFTVHSALFLNEGGRMGLVLPAELLSVNYAAEIRKFLMASFAEVHLVMFDERVFPGVLEEVVLLLADGYKKGPAEHASIYQVESPDELDEAGPGYIWTPSHPEAKWTTALLSKDAMETYSAALQSSSFTTLDVWGDTTLGMVTGNNKYFGLSPAKVRELGLKRSDLIRLSPPGSKHLRGLELTPNAMRRLGENGSATWLFRPNGEPSAAAQAYIDAGHIAGVDTAYKCRVRKPWWRVPLVKPADLLITCMNSDTPRITTNRAKAHHLNSVHGIYLKPEYRDVGQRTLPLASLNSLTLLGAEMVGRAYGGGLLKLEPREADSLPVPTPELTAKAGDELEAIRDTVTAKLQGGDLLGAVALVDEILLGHGMGFTATQMKGLRDARSILVARRNARGAHPRETINQ